MRSHIRALLSAALLVCAATPAAVAQTLPTPWNSTDVGSPAVRGNASFGTGTFTVNGAGTDIGGTADQFFMVYRPLSGDGEIVARVESLTRTDNQAKAGVMIREALTPDSRHAMMTISASKGHWFLRRPVGGGMSVSSAALGGGAPGWVKLSRTADTFVASWSTDGVTWTTVGSDTIPMGETVYIGLAVTSRDRRRLARGIFSNVTVTSSGSGNQSPAVTITRPANGAQLSLPATVTIDATATDPENRMASVGFYVNNTLVATDTTAPYSTSWSPSAAGTYTLAAMAQDADGGSSWSTNVSVTVQGPNSPPAVNLTSPANGAKFPAPATISLTATATDADGPIDRVEFFSGTTLLGADTSQPYSFTWSNVPAGSYNLRAVAYDTGGANASSATVAVTVGGTNSPPTVTLTSPANGATFTAPATIGLAATASDAEGPIAKVEFYSGATLLWVENLTPYADSWTNVPAGTYTLTAVAYDGQGAKTTSAPVTVTVKGPNGAPTVALTSPANGSTLTAPATINLAANASDPENQLARVEFYSGTTLLATDTSAPYAWSWSAVAAGTYTLTAKAFDAAGTQATSAAVTVTVNGPNSPPTVGLTSPTSGASFTAPATITLSANATDPQGGLARVEFFSGTVRLATVTTAPYTFTWSNVAAGAYSLTAVAYDTGGLSATSAAVSITVGTASSTPPTGVVFTASIDHATNVTSYLLSVYAANANPATATPIATSDLGKPTPAANNDITVDRASFFAALPVGNYQATVTAIGPGGSTRSSSITFSR
jgi:hypothetical protein